VRPTSRREDEALLVRQGALPVLDLGRTVVDRQRAPIPELLAREEEALLVRRDALLGLAEDHGQALLVGRDALREGPLRELALLVWRHALLG